MFSYFASEYFVFIEFVLFKSSKFALKCLHKINIRITLMEFCDNTFVADKI